MQLAIVTNSRKWLGHLTNLDTIWVPGTVASLAFFHSQNISHKFSSDLLTRDDYHEIWSKALQAVKGGVVRENTIGLEGPRWARLTAYPYFLYLCYIALLERMYDRLNNLFGIDSILVEDKHPMASGGFDLSSRGYECVAIQWGQKRGIPVESLPESLSGGKLQVPLDVAGAVIRLARKGIRVILEPFLLFWAVTKLTALFIRSSPNILFYVPFKRAGLTEPAPMNAIDVTVLLRWMRYWGRVRRSKIPRSVGMGHPVFPFEPTAISEECKDFWERTVSSFQASHEGRESVAEVLVKWAKKHFSRVGWVAASPFCGLGSYELSADIFLRAGAVVAGVQHGGNYPVCQRGAVPYRFFDGGGGLFCQWGEGESDETDPWPEGPPLRRARVGSSWQGKLVGRADHFRSREGSVLYCPTLLAPGTIHGVNIVWDRYWHVVRQVLRLLNDSGLAVTVKVLPTTEWKEFPWTDYPRLEVFFHGGAWRRMRAFETILVDGIQCSPVYEALATRSNLLIYEGTEYAVIDPRFKEALRRRAVCCPTGPEYVNAVNEFVKKRLAFFAEQGAQRTDETVLRRYLNPVSLKDFWKNVNNAIFEDQEEKNMILTRNSQLGARTETEKSGSISRVMRQ